MDVGFEAHLQLTDTITFGTSDAKLLHAIDTHGSLNAAATALGRSYSRALERITDLETAIGDTLVERQRGGRDGGGSHLTPTADSLLAQFTRLQAAMTGTAETEETVLEGTVRDQDGELATIDTPVGPVRALLFDNTDRVQITFRSDAITLHTPETAPPVTGTSARNRFDGTVTEINRGEVIATVHIDIGQETTITALITHDSIDELNLGIGDQVIASFKATATRATATT